MAAPRKQEIDYKKLSVEAILKRHKQMNLIIILLHILTLPIIALLAYITVVYGFGAFMVFFFAVGVVAYNYALRTWWKVKASDLNMILLKDCDPVKYITVFETLKNDKFQPYSASLNIARGLYYAGRFEEALEAVNKLEVPKVSSPRIFQYYSVMANVYDAIGDEDKLISLRERTQGILSNTKVKSIKAANGRQLLTIIDNMLAGLHNNYQHCRETSEELLEIASYPLSRITAAWRMAKLETTIGAHKSAMDRCEYIIDDGGSTFFVEDAKKMLDICRGRR